jgi:hypothetical protein
MKKVKASKTSTALTRATQSETSVGLPFDLYRWVEESAKAKNMPPAMFASLELRKRQEDSRRADPPFNPETCTLIARWDGADDTWERLLFNSSANKFYLEWSFCDACDVKISEALHWYGCKRVLDCDFGSLSWPNIELLISAAVHELQFSEEMQSKPAKLLRGA